MNIQYKKGVLELCVLSMLAKRDWYGYEISESLSKKIDIADGTVYPILRKLKSDGFVVTPQITPISLASRISSVFAVSRKNFIAAPLQS